MLVIAKRGLAADNIQEEDGDVASAGNVIRGEAVGVAFSADIIRRELPLQLFPTKLQGLELL